MHTAFDSSRGGHSTFKGTGTTNRNKRIINSRKASLVKDFMSVHNQTVNNWSPRETNMDKEQRKESENTMQRSIFNNTDINLFLNMIVQSPKSRGKEPNTASQMRYHSVLKPREESKIFERVLSTRRLSESIQGKSTENQ